MINKKAFVNITRRDILKIGAGAVITQMVGFAGLASANNPVGTDLPPDNSEELAKIGNENNSNFPFLIIRLHPRHHRNKETLAEVLELLRNNPGVCNEAWFCTEFGFPDLQKHRESAVLISEAAIEIRKLGINAGLQIANTIGHGGPFISGSSRASRKPFVGHDGIIAGCNCPRDEEFLNYQRQLADIYASAFQPSSIWIDDDLRMNSHPPVQYGCFCEKCLSDFSKLQGKTRTREELAAELVKPRQYSQLRQDWVAFGMSGLANVARVIAEAAVKKAPDCRMGLQQCSLDWSTYYGPDMKQIFSAMEKATGRKPGSRLGHGYYNDHAPREVLVKSFGIARQVERAIGSAEQICPEVENTNHTTMGKSPRGTAIESTLHMAMGCNSLSFALWNDMHLEGPEPMELFLNKFKIWLPLWKLMARYNENSSLGGLDLTFGRHHAGRPIHEDEKPWDSWNVHSGDVMKITTLGLPLCPDSPLACASLLTAETASGLTNEELTQLFKGGVLLDGKAVSLLQDRSLDFDLGVHASFQADTGAIEILTRDALNGDYKGVNWYQFDNSFYKLSFSGAHRVLGEMKSVTGELLGCSTAVFENGLGGRVGVLGFNGFQNLLSSAKRMQLLNMADWISKGNLPAILETSEQVVVCPRMDKSSGALKCVTLLNASIGETQPLSLRLRHAQTGSAIMYSAEGRWETRLKTHRENSDLMVNVPSISPWGIVFLVLT